MSLSIFLYERSLTWTVPLSRAAQNQGWTARSMNQFTVPEGATPHLAVVNLGDAGDSAAELVAALQAKGTHVIGHAGHKEADLLQSGNQAGCNQVVTNRTLKEKFTELVRAACPDSNSSIIE